MISKNLAVKKNFSLKGKIFKISYKSNYYLNNL